MVFRVKSTSDPYFQQGVRLGESIYSCNGHTRHVFDEPQLRNLLGGWLVHDLEDYRGHSASSQESAFIRVVATRPDA